MSDAPRLIHDLLLLVSYVSSRRDGAPVDEVAELLGVERNELMTYVDTLLLCGKPPFLPDDLVDIGVENDRVYVDIDQELGRPLRFTSQEALAMSVALRTLASGDTPYAETATRALGKLKARLADDVAGRVEEMEQRIVVEGTSRATEERLKVLQQGLDEKREVELEYYTASRDELNERRVRLYLLAQHLGYWYAIGFDLLRDAIRIFKVERIRDAHLTDTTFEIPDDFDVEAFRRDRMFHPDQQAQTARIRFYPPASRFVVDAMLTEKFEEEADGSVIAHIEFVEPEWLASFVLSYGADAEVLEPDVLRDAVLTRCRAALALYS